MNLSIENAFKILKKINGKLAEILKDTNAYFSLEVCPDCYYNIIINCYPITHSKHYRISEEQSYFPETLLIKAYKIYIAIADWVNDGHEFTSDEAKTINFDGINVYADEIISFMNYLEKEEI